MADNQMTPAPPDLQPPPPRRAAWIWGIVLLAVIGGGWYAWNRAASPPKALAAATPAAIPVTAVHVVTRDLPISRSGLGTVTPLSQVDVKVRVDGQVQRIAFTEGQEVKAGELLAQIDPRPYQAQLAQAQSTLQKDTAQLNNARNDEVRTARLNAVGAGTTQASDVAKSQVAVNTALTLGDQAAVDVAKLNLGYTTITAPVAGRVGLKQVNEGAIVRATDALGLVSITQMQPIAIQFSLPQDELPDVVAGQAKAPLSVSVDSRDGSRHLADGKLTVIDSQVETSTGTIKLKAEFANEDRALWPGALVTARVVVRTDAQALVVPSLAIQNGQKGPYLFVVKPDNTVAIAQVKTGPTVGDVTAVTAGIAVGDNVVLSGQSRLAQGTKVSITQADGQPQRVAMETQ